MKKSNAISHALKLRELRKSIHKGQGGIMDDVLEETPTSPILSGMAVPHRVSAGGYENHHM